jgi:hypothetical protein
MRTIPTLNPSAWDELLKAHRPSTYYWFIVILGLKLVVNIIFLLGQAYQYNWGACPLQAHSQWCHNDP